MALPDLTGQNIQDTYQRVLQTDGGVILPDIAQEDTMQAEVIAVGGGLFTQTGDKIPMTVKVGDTVMLHARLLKGDNEVTFEDQKYVLVRESDIAMISC